MTLAHAHEHDVHVHVHAYAQPSVHRVAAWWVCIGLQPRRGTPMQAGEGFAPLYGGSDGQWPWAVMGSDESLTLTLPLTLTLTLTLPLHRHRSPLTAHLSPFTLNLTLTLTLTRFRRVAARVRVGHGRHQRAASLRDARTARPATPRGRLGAGWPSPHTALSPALSPALSLAPAPALVPALTPGRTPAP